MPGGSRFWVDEFICLPLSPRLAWMSGAALICLPLSLHLSPVLFQPGCLAWLFGWTDSFVSRCLPLFVPGSHGFMRGVFRGQACVFEAQKRVAEHAHALDQATGSMLRMHA